MSAAIRHRRSNRAGAALVAALLIPWPGSPPNAAQTEAPPAADHPFIIFDGMIYIGKPDLRLRGLVPVAGSGEIWSPGVSRDMVDEGRIANLLRPYRNSAGYYYFDIENWPLVGVESPIRNQNIEKLTRVIDIARRTAPNTHFGFYGLLPGITYWPLVFHDSNFKSWQKVNRELEPLARRVDVVFPSLYTFYDDPAGWENYARQTLVEARRYHKPVYPFIWPEYHDSNEALRGHEIPPAVWRAELELCAELADGVLLWGGYQKHWDERAAWWRETQVFIQSRRAGDDRSTRVENAAGH